MLYVLTTGSGTHGTKSPRVNNPLLIYYPRYKPDKDEYDDYYRVKLALHHPFETVHELLLADIINQQFDTFVMAMQRN